MEPDYLWKIKFWISKTWAWTWCSQPSAADPVETFQWYCFVLPGKSILAWGMVFSYPQKWNHLYSLHDYSNTMLLYLRLSSFNFFLPHLSSINKWKYRNSTWLRQIFKKQNVWIGLEKVGGTGNLKWSTRDGTAKIIIGYI